MSIGPPQLHTEVVGSGVETIVFAHGLLWDGRLWDRQVAALAGRFRCVTFDFRGQGRSEVTEAGYDMETLAEDTVTLVESLQTGPVHLVGLSMGGFVGMRVAARRPDLVRTLTLVNTSADPEARSALPKYRLLNFIARWFGLRPVVGQVMGLLFGRSFLADAANAGFIRSVRERLLANDRVGITRAVKGVIGREGVEAELGRIVAPTLIVAGEEDVATPTAKAARIHAAISGSELVVLPKCGHTAPYEATDALNRLLLSHLER